MGLLRFLLACIVVLSHTSTIFGYAAIPSDLAVQSFYVISGFYMSLVLNEKYPKGSNKLFFKNRALKIYPVYWFILILLIAWDVLVNLLGYPSTIKAYQSAVPFSAGTWAYLITANILIFGLDWLFLFGIDKGQLFFTKTYISSHPNVYLFGFNSIAWTVGVELLFYLIAPFIVRKRLYLVLLLLFGSLLLRIVLAEKGMSNHPWDYMFFPTQLMFFMGGCISYRIYLFIRTKRISKHLLKAQYMLLLVVVLLYSYISNNSYYLQSMLFTCLVLFIPASFIVSKNNKIDRGLGNLSYPVYISQMLVINVTEAKTFPKIISHGFTALVLTILLSLLLYNFITKPIEKVRQSPFR